MSVIGGATLTSVYNEQCVIVVVKPSPHCSSQLWKDKQTAIKWNVSMHGCKRRGWTRTRRWLHWNTILRHARTLSWKKGNNGGSGATPWTKQQVPTWLRRPRQRCPIANRAHGSKGGRAGGRAGRPKPAFRVSLALAGRPPPPSSSTTTTTTSCCITSRLAALTKEHHRCQRLLSHPNSLASHSSLTCSCVFLPRFGAVSVVVTGFAGEVARIAVARGCKPLARFRRAILPVRNIPRWREDCSP